METTPSLQADNVLSPSTPTPTPTSAPQPTPTSPNPSAIKAQASATLMHERYHLTLTLPATETHGELQVSYADVGRQASDQVAADEIPTVLFMRGMFGSRLQAVSMHAVALEMGVRVLTVERFGMGRSTNVAFEQRIPIWLEIVQALLKHLNLKHVALASHSAGTMYNLNTIWHFRDILYPQRPFVALLAPWVDPTKSGVKLMRAVQYLPSSVFSLWNKIPQFANNTLAPMVASSSSLFTSSSLSSGGSDNGDGTENDAWERNRVAIEDRYGTSRQLQRELETLMTRIMFDEGTEGANSEARLCARKGQDGMWGVCDDYAVFVRELAEKERSRIQIQTQTQTQANSNEQAQLRVKAYFAESDALIGKKGQLYMQSCWQGEDSEYGDIIDFETSGIEAADHDLVCCSVRVLEDLFREVRESHG